MASGSAWTVSKPDFSKLCKRTNRWRLIYFGLGLSPRTIIHPCVSRDSLGICHGNRAIQQYPASTMLVSLCFGHFWMERSTKHVSCWPLHMVALMLLFPIPSFKQIVFEFDALLPDADRPDFTTNKFGSSRAKANQAGRKCRYRMNAALIED